MIWFSICKTHFQIPFKNPLSSFSIQDGTLGNKWVSGGKHFIFRPKVTWESALPLFHMTSKINLPFCTRFSLHISRDERNVWYIQHDSTHPVYSPKPRPPNGPSHFPTSQFLEGRVLILCDSPQHLQNAGHIGKWAINTGLTESYRGQFSDTTLGEKCLWRISNTQTLLSRCRVLWIPEASLL